MSRYIDHGTRTVVPIRDFAQTGAPAAFCVIVYGATRSDLAMIGGGIGSRPLRRAVERLRLDPNRFQATLWDLA